ncbi:helix-turn-helix domain-containing protein [uncultured Desulfovibrio sp.]|uniref:helix-turn-helix domain-containing protein n=1 Tax=uncultured Desulfovibrio sp. TaxID=167968 RepID=UPI0026DDAA6B|nr:helix-turn-helix transcriptional regulator [uncultured Desulfovibrio sp.]
MNQSEKRISRSILLGRRIRTYRERAGLTIAQLAALADVAPTTLAELERGKGNPRYETLCNLAAGLGIPITVLVQYEDMMLRDIYIESAKELLILFNELSDEERKKLNQLILIFQRINSWKEKN